MGVELVATANGEILPTGTVVDDFTPVAVAFLYMCVCVCVCVCLCLRVGVLFIHRLS